MPKESNIEVRQFAGGRTVPTMPAVPIQQYKPDIKNTYLDIPSFISEILVHLSADGLLVSGDTAQRYFQLSSAMRTQTIDDTRMILKLLVCKTESDVETFEASFYRYFYPVPPSPNEKARQAELEKKKQENKSLQSSLNKLAEKDVDGAVTQAEQALDNFEKNSLKPNDDSKIEKQLHKFADKDFQLLQQMMESSGQPFAQSLSAVLSGNINTLSQEQLNDIISHNNSILKMLATPKTAKAMQPMAQLMTAIKAYAKANFEYDQMLQAKRMALQKAMKDRDKAQAEIERKLQQIASNENFIQKSQAVTHRMEFKGKNAVQTIYEDVGELGRQDIKHLSADQKKQVYDYIRRNSQKFYTVLRRRMRTMYRRTIDMKETVRHACETGGIPMKIAYQKQKPSKPNVVMLLDISGSCRSASEMMLVYMHYMKRVFRGGCRAFAFVGHLYDITDSMYLPEAEEAVKAVLNTIPTRGVYSDYNLAFNELQDSYDSVINSDSIVIYIGDARNNKNDSAVEIVKKYADRAKKTYWINTENKHMWDTGDSIMSTYEPHMDKTEEVLTVDQLTNFLLAL